MRLLLTTAVKSADFRSNVSVGGAEQLRQATGNAGAELMPILTPGEHVRVVNGVLAGLEAVVTQVLPAKERVKLLLESLRRETIVEAASTDLLPDCHYSNVLLAKPLDDRQRASETR